MNRYDDVLRFWFDELRPRDWWKASRQVDEAIRLRFGALQRAVAADPPDGATLDAREHVGAVLVLDQLPRNLYRGSAQAFASDPAALAIASHALDHGLDGSLSHSERQFLYMPLMHAEDPAVQQRSLQLFAALDDADALRSARRHAETIERFGRFPTRNAALGRTSSEAERVYLATVGSKSR